MGKRNNSNDTNNLGIGMSTGIALGFILGMLINIMLIPIGIAFGSLYDNWKSKQDN